MGLEDSIRLFFKRFKADNDETLKFDHLTDGLIRLRLISYQNGSDYVGFLPTYYFSIVKVENPYIEVGRCDLRIGQAPEIPYAGHIGYRVHVHHRGRNYAKKATKLLLGFADELGIERLLITCDPDNIPSRKTLESLGGIYEGILTVPRDSVCYRVGDRLKCQFWYETKNFAFKKDLQK